MSSHPDLLFKYTVGEQDTTTLSDFVRSMQLNDFLWMTKLSIASFHRWFPEARFLLMVNAQDFERFKVNYYKTQPILDFEVEIVWQRCEKFRNPYHFPCGESGVWWKWIPFRYDVNCTEIAVDTDIICISEPISWKEWIGNDSPIMSAPERFHDISASTCGNLHKHPVLDGHKPLNCGVVGQKAGFDFSEIFYETTKLVTYRENDNSRFIDEQGCINVWARQLERDGVKLDILDFNKNAWMRDFLFFLSKGVDVETVHAVAWYKKLLNKLKIPFEKRVFNNDYTNDEFITDILNTSSLNDLDRHVLIRQFEEKMPSDDYLVRSFV